MQPIQTLVRTALASLLLPTTLLATPAQSPAERINVTSAGLQTGGFANQAVVSADGNFVAFHSSIDDLVPGDTNFARDVFVRDRSSGVTQRVSVSSAGAQGNHHSDFASISADGRYVLFTSRASNLVPGDTNGSDDIFLRDRLAGTTVRISLGPGGVQGNSWSREGKLTPDGKYAVFTSAASNLLSVAGPFVSAVFRREIATGSNTLISVSTGGALPDLASWFPAISDDGTLVAFQSTATNLVANDTNGHVDVFVRDLVAGTTTRVSESSAGVQGNSYSQEAEISGDGRFVTFESRATTLVVPPDLNTYEDVYLHDRQTGQTTLISADVFGVVGNFTCSDPHLSGDGRFLTFQGWASNLVAGDTNLRWDIFVYDRLADILHRVDLDTAGGESDDHSYAPSLSHDGRWVVFESFASDLVTGDTNAASDIFLVDFLGSPACPPAATYCTSKPTSIAGCLPKLGFSGSPSASAGSGFVITAGPTPGTNAGLFLYTTSGSAASPLVTPFGSLCVAAPFIRIAPQTGGGSLGTCSGQYTIDFNQFFATQTADPTLVAGAQVDVQCWFRDPPVAGGAAFSEAGRFLMCP